MSTKARRRLRTFAKTLKSLPLKDLKEVYQHLKMATFWVRYGNCNELSPHLERHLKAYEIAQREMIVRRNAGR